jgi:hypothetical protein
MDPLQKILLKANANATCIEYLADLILTYPRCVWSDYGENQNCTRNVCSCVQGECFEILKCPFLLLIWVTAAPFLLIGAPLKLFILYCDSDAKNYSELISINIIAEPEMRKTKIRIDDIEFKIQQLKGDIDKQTQLALASKSELKTIKKIKANGRDANFDDAVNLINKYESITQSNLNKSNDIIFIIETKVSQLLAEKNILLNVNKNFDIEL